MGEKETVSDLEGASVKIPSGSCHVIPSTSNPKATKFFPLWKLKGTHPARTPAVWEVHLEEESTIKEDGTKSKDPNGTEGINEECIVHLEGGSAGGEMLLPLQQPGKFYP